MRGWKLDKKKGHNSNFWVWISSGGVGFHVKGWAREHKRRGRGKEWGGQPHEPQETPHGKQFPTPPASVHFPPPHPVSLTKSLRNSQNFPQVTPKGPSSRGFALRYVLPPFGSAQAKNLACPLTSRESLLGYPGVPEKLRTKCLCSSFGP